MAAELVNATTSENLKEMDWTKSIEICELVARDQGQARDVIKALRKRLGSKNPNTLLFAVMLLEMLMNNCGEHIHRQVIEVGLLPLLVKIVKKKSDLPVREKIFFLLDATQISLGGASGKFPQYHAAYCDLVSAGVQFPQHASIPPSDIPIPKVGTESSPARESGPPKCDKVSMQSTSQTVPESSIISKARSAMEVLKEVLDALNPRNPEGAKDEFTLDLVEQCSFQKQRVMHLAITSRDEKLVSEAIELNEQLQKVLSKHDALLSVHATTTPASFADEEAEEEEETDQLFRRIRKGKAHAEDMSGVSPSSNGSIPAERLNRPLIRPLHPEPVECSVPPSVVSIPPPPAKHKERERFFKEKQAEGTTLPGHMRGLSLHSRNGSSSCNGSTDSNE
ncbi:target of Myb protein 1 [Cinnamomum micranthum f. kanehirae]|uniref:Target of Myb protein 1 n=1 Tax=Cinnamomum micranthum f. kanehirae TaxID=337451 RepID=A0A3S3N2D9_9MAGN|nr:target of Myb protein 1 [Cinnamomum micranthum f. kanehirae]